MIDKLVSAKSTGYAALMKDMASFEHETLSTPEMPDMTVSVPTPPPAPPANSMVQVSMLATQADDILAAELRKSLLEDVSTLKQGSQESHSASATPEVPPAIPVALTVAPAKDVWRKARLQKKIQRQQAFLEEESHRALREIQQKQHALDQAKLKLAHQRLMTAKAQRVRSAKLQQLTEESARLTDVARQEAVQSPTTAEKRPEFKTSQPSELILSQVRREALLLKRQIESVARQERLALRRQKKKIKRRVQHVMHQQKEMAKQKAAMEDAAHTLKSQQHFLLEQQSQLNALKKEVKARESAAGTREDNLDLARQALRSEKAALARQKEKAAAMKKDVEVERMELETQQMRLKRKMHAKKEALDDIELQIELKRKEMRRMEQKQRRKLAKKAMAFKVEQDNYRQETARNLAIAKRKRQALTAGLIKLEAQMAQESQVDEEDEAVLIQPLQRAWAAQGHHAPTQTTLLKQQPEVENKPTPAPAEPKQALDTILAEHPALSAPVEQVPNRMLLHPIQTMRQAKRALENSSPTTAKRQAPAAVEAKPEKKMFSHDTHVAALMEVTNDIMGAGPDDELQEATRRIKLPGLAEAQERQRFTEEDWGPEDTGDDDVDPW